MNSDYPPNPVLVSDCCVKNITVSSKDEQLYGLRENDSVVLKRDDNRWIQIGDTSCDALTASKDGGLFCLKDGSILELNPDIDQWIYLMMDGDCIHFDVANTFIVYVTTGNVVKRVNRGFLRKYLITFLIYEEASVFFISPVLHDYIQYF